MHVVVGHNSRHRTAACSLADLQFRKSGQEFLMAFFQQRLNVRRITLANPGHDLLVLGIHRSLIRLNIVDCRLHLPRRQAVRQRNLLSHVPVSKVLKYRVNRYPRPFDFWPVSAINDSGFYHGFHPFGIEWRLTADNSTNYAALRLRSRAFRQTQLTPSPARHTAGDTPPSAVCPPPGHRRTARPWDRS